MDVPVARVATRMTALRAAILLFAILSSAIAAELIPQVSANGFGPSTPSFDPAGHARLQPSVQLWDSWQGDDKRTGHLRLGPYTLDRTFSLHIAGYPAEKGAVIAWEDAQDGRRQLLEPRQVPRERWTLYRWSVPPSWRGKSVYLVAEDQLVDANGWLGVSAPVPPAARFAALANQMGWHGLLFVALLVPGAGATLWWTRHRILRAEMALASTLILSATCATALYFIYYTHAATGRNVAAGVLLLGTIALVSGWRARHPLFPWRELVRPLAAAFAAGLLYTAVLFLYGGIEGPLAVPMDRFLWKLPPDTTLPYLITVNFANGEPLRPFLGTWLTSDRPPLQTAFGLLVYPIAPGPLAQQIMGTVLQTWVFLGAWILMRFAALPVRTIAWAVFFAVFGGFFLLNGTFIWPKLLPAAFLLMAAAFLFYERERTGWLAGACAGLAMLGHGGSAFGIIGLGVTSLLHPPLRRWRYWGAAVAAGLLYLLPWSLYQKFCDPPGDRLLKWHLAGVENVDPRPLGQTLRESYGALSLRDFVEGKLLNATRQLYHGDVASEFGHARRHFSAGDTDLGWRNLTNALRAGCFFNLFQSPGPLLIGAIGLVLLARRRSRDPAAWRFVVLMLTIVTTTTAIWCVLTFTAGSAVNHHGSYLNNAGLFLALAVGAVALRPWFRRVLAGGTMIWFGVIWVLQSDRSFHTTALLPAAEPLQAAWIALTAVATLVALGWLGRFESIPAPAAGLVDVPPPSDDRNSVVATAVAHPLHRNDAPAGALPAVAPTVRPVARRGFRLSIVCAFCLAAAGAKFVLIGGWGSDIPFWDQWDDMGERIILQEATGGLTATTFLQPHNEHRIAFTRMLSLALIKLNGQWDARVEMTVNVILHLAALALLLGWSSRALRPAGVALLASLLAILAGLPMGIENTLAGFQSQFYFLLLFAFAHIGGTAFSRPGSPRWWAGQFAGAAGLFAMASGFVSSLVVLALTLGRVACERRRPSAIEAFSAAWCGALVLAAVLLRVDVADHAPLRASSVTQWMTSFAWLASWPLASPLGWAVTFLPIGWSMIAAARSGFRHVGFTIAASIGLWWLLQISLLAYGRGSSGQALAPRYFDLLAIGLVAGALGWTHAIAALSSNGRGRAGWALAAAAAWVGIIGCGLQHQTAAQLTSLRDLSAVNAAREAAVQQFVLGRLPSLAGKQPWYELPHPNSAALENWLRQPVLRALLPPSVRPPLSMDAAPNADGGLRRDALPESLSSAIPTWSSQPDVPVEWSSAPQQTQFPLLRFNVAGTLGAPDGRLALVTENREQRIEPRHPRRTTWGRVVVDAPSGPFHMETATTRGHWIAFSDPIEIGWLSWSVEKLLKLGWRTAAVGAVALAGIVMLAFRPTRIPCPAFWRVWAAAGLALPLGFLNREELTGNARLLHAASTESWAEGDFVSGGTYPTTVAGALTPDRRTLGSWRGGDQWQGDALTPWFPADARRIEVLVAGYPRTAGCSLTIGFRHRNGLVSEIAYPFDSPGERWARWEIGVPASATEIQLRARDASSGFQGWLAFSEPYRAPYMAGTWLMIAQVCATLALVGSVAWAPAFLGRLRLASSAARFLREPASNVGWLILGATFVGMANPNSWMPSALAVAATLWLAAGALAWREGRAQTPGSPPESDISPTGRTQPQLDVARARGP